MPAKGQKMSEEAKLKMSEAKFKDISGLKFGKFTVISFSHFDKVSRSYYVCKCDCGEIHTILRSRIVQETARPCKCVKRTRKSVFGRKHSLETKEKIRRKAIGRKPSVETRLKLKESRKNRVFSEETRKKISEIQKRRTKHPYWKGGITKLHIPLYDTYANKFELIEEVRRNPGNQEYLQVKCTYCGKWITPTINAVYSRLKGIEGKSESRFYCSGLGCRSQCSIFHRIKYPKGFKNGSSREVQPELRKLVFERDAYACQKCGATSPLHCHHIDPVANNPLESADMDNCITLCKPCHKEAHEIPGCSGQELRCGGAA